MVQVQQLPYIHPRKERSGKSAIEKPPRLPSPKSLKAMQYQAKLVKLCRENGVPDCKDNVPVWKLRRYLKQKGITAP